MRIRSTNWFDVDIPSVIHAKSSAVNAPTVGRFEKFRNSNTDDPRLLLTRPSAFLRLMIQNPGDGRLPCRTTR